MFASDHEHQVHPDQALADFARDADLVYMDAQYQRQEYDGRVGLCDEPPMPRAGWGHSTYTDAITTAVAAGAARIHLGHHDPKRDDADLDRLWPELEAELRRLLQEYRRPAGSARLLLVYEGYELEI